MKRLARHLSFKAKALLLLGFLQLGGLLVLGLLAYEQSQDVLRRLAEDRFRLTTEQLSREVATFVRDESRLVLLLSQLSPIRSLGQARRAVEEYEEGQALYEMLTSQLEQIFLSTVSTHPQCLDIAYLDDQGLEMVKVGWASGVPAVVPAIDLRHRGSESYFRETSNLEAGQVYISSLMHDTETSPLTFWISMPVFDTGDHRAGVLIFHIDPGTLLARIRNPLPEGRAFLVDHTGRVLYHSHQPLPFAPPHLANIHPLLAGHLATDKTESAYAAFELEGPDHHLCMHGYSRIAYDPFEPDHYWAVVLDAPAEAVFAPAAELRDRFLRWGGLIVALSLALTLALSQSLIVRPVLDLERVAGRVADGDLHPEMPSWGNVGSKWKQAKDEIARLYAAFGIMVDRLRQATEHLQEQVRARTAALEKSEARLEAQNQELARLNAYKSHLLSVVSHELKTPLASLDGFNRIINRIFLTGEFITSLPGPQRPVIEQVRRRVERMDQNILRLIRLVDELLDFSRIDRGKGLEMHRQPIDLRPIAVEAVDNYRELGAEKGISVDCELPPEDEGMWALADADRIIQVFDNLLNNAIKFTDEGGSVRVRAHFRDDCVEFEIRDSGEGMAPQALERIFELYEQAGDAVSRKQGTGIGLSIARYIVEQHGGYIRAVSDGPGQGSTFTFGLPRCQRPEPAPARAVS